MKGIMVTMFTHTKKRFTWHVWKTLCSCLCVGKLFFMQLNRHYLYILSLLSDPLEECTEVLRFLRFKWCYLSKIKEKHGSTQMLSGKKINILKISIPNMMSLGCYFTILIIKLLMRKTILRRYIDFRR